MRQTNSGAAVVGSIETAPARGRLLQFRMAALTVDEYLGLRWTMMSDSDHVQAESLSGSLNSVVAVVWSFLMAALPPFPRLRTGGEARSPSRVTRSRKVQQPSIGHEFGCTWIDFARMIRGFARQHGPSSRLVLDRNAANE